MATLLELTEFREAEQYAYALTKRTYEVRGTVCVEVESEPFRAVPKKQPLAAGNETVPFKPRTDIVVHGSAYAKNGVSVDKMLVQVSLGALRRKLLVHGPRPIVWRAEKPVIEPPGSFVEMPLTYQNAYGGVDRRVRPRGAVSLMQFGLAALQADHPGLYPRNPIGKGYLVVPEPLEGAEAPNVEHPDDVLTEDRLIVGDPSQWHRQPLPAGLDWFAMSWFPRMLAAGVEPWFPVAVTPELPEVKRGLVAPSFGSPSDEMHQEASPGFTLDELQGGEAVQIVGMHPDESNLRFRLPKRLETFRFCVEGTSHDVRPRAHTVEIWPARKRLTIVWGALCKLPRVFIAGVHKYVPISVSIDGEAPVDYQAPPTIHDQLVAAGLRPHSGAFS